MRRLLVPGGSGYKVGSTPASLPCTGDCRWLAHVRCLPFLGCASTPVHVLQMRCLVHSKARWELLLQEHRWAHVKLVFQHHPAQLVRMQGAALAALAGLCKEAQPSLVQA